MSANNLNYKKIEDSNPPAKGLCVSDLESIDKRLRRLRDEVFPISPYLLTVPTDVPFRLGNRFVNNWAVGKDGPFSPEEQQLQYMTFLMHHDVDSLLVAVGDWSDNHGNIMAQDDSKPASVTSAASTPLSTSTKKKITLSDYNTKAKSGPPAVATSSEEGKGGNVRNARAADGKQRTSKSNSADGTTSKRQPNPHATSSPKTNGVSSKKRSSLELSENPGKPQEKTRHESPSKRPRLSNLKSTQQETSRASSTNNVLPALLSPTLPPSSISPRIPELLSPTLPPEIEEELARLGDNSPAKSLSEKRDTSSMSMTSKDETGKSKGSNRQRLHSASTSCSSNQGIDLKKTEAANKTASSASREPARKEPAVRAAEKPTQSDSLGPETKSNASPAGERLGLGITNIRPRLVVRLKYGRPNRKLVEALLKMKRKSPSGNALPRLAKEPVPPPPAKREEDQSGSNEILSTLKRPRTVDSDEAQETSNKRPKGAMSSVLPEKEKPRTPVLAALKSLSAQQQQQQSVTSKTLLSTPKKDIRGAAALRQPESGDRDVKTPLGVANKSTPGSVEKPARMSPPPSSNGQVNRSQDTERRAWKEEFQKYAKLGRELKHAADRHTRSKATSEKITSGDEKLAAATAVEAILCFILAFIADDRSKALARQIGDSSTWRSILAYWKVVKMTTGPYPHLHGLCLLLGAVSHDAIHSIDLERLAVSSLPGEHSPVPTPGSDGNTVTSEESKQYRKEFLDLKSRLPKYYKEANHLWLEGSRELSEDVIIQEFPITWSKRSINFPERGRQQPKKIGEYPDEFFLPLGRMTTPIEAVRFGLCILSEWCKKEDVQWEGRFDLA
ncbi:hypothetical protein V8E54_009492 [Elaphomyces granulatus]